MCVAAKAGVHGFRARGVAAPRNDKQSYLRPLAFNPFSSAAKDCDGAGISQRKPFSISLDIAGIDMRVAAHHARVRADRQPPRRCDGIPVGPGS